VLASFAVGRWKYNGLVLGQTVDAHIEEAAHGQTQKGEYDYEKYCHGCLLWTYGSPEVNSSLVLLPRVDYSAEAGPSSNPKDTAPFDIQTVGSGRLASGDRRLFARRSEPSVNSAKTSTQVPVVNLALTI
jgi:hypothetical protein